MPSARADEFRRAAARLSAGAPNREPRTMEASGRACHHDPIHGGRQIGPPLFYRILNQLGIDEKEFDQLRPPLRRPYFEATGIVRLWPALGAMDDVGDFYRIG